MKARTSSLSALRSNAGVGMEVRQERVDDVGSDERVVDRALHRDPPELLHEVLLALDPPDVGGGVERAPPLPGFGVVRALGIEDLEVPGPDPLQRGRAVELVAARAVGVDQPVNMSRVTPGDVHRHRADRVHDALEGLEVDLEVVVDRHVEVRLQRVDDLLRDLG